MLNVKSQSTVLRYLWLWPDVNILHDDSAIPHNILFRSDDYF